jgi:hypothetical protein
MIMDRKSITTTENGAPDVQHRKIFFCVFEWIGGRGFMAEFSAPFVVHRNGELWNFLLRNLQFRSSVSETRTVSPMPSPARHRCLSRILSFHLPHRQLL